MVTFIEQVYALTWKNYVLKRRHWLSTLSEYIIPIIYLFFYLAATGTLFPEDTSA